MKTRVVLSIVPVWICLGCLAVAQEKRPPTAAVEGIKGVKEEAVQKVKNLETGNPAVPQPVVPVAGPGVNQVVPQNKTEGVNKVDGINTINGVKADGRTVVVPPPPTVPTTPPPPPPPVAQPVVPVTGPGVNKIVPENKTEGVNKIDGINTVNGVKADGRTAVVPPPPVVKPVAPPVVGTAVNVPAGTVGAGGTIRAINGVTGINAAKLRNLEAALQIKEGGTPGDGKAKAAAAGLLGNGPGLKPGPKPDGRSGFQEFEKLPNTGS